MARWTQSRDEERHLAEVNRELSQVMAKGFVLQVVLKDGRSVEGLLTQSKFGNNPATDEHPVEYYCEFTLRLLDKTLMVLDALDVQSIANVSTKERLARYTRPAADIG